MSRVPTVGLLPWDAKDPRHEVSGVFVWLGSSCGQETLAVRVPATGTNRRPRPQPAVATSWDQAS